MESQKAWVEVVENLLTEVLNLPPRLALAEWRLMKFGSHCYNCCLPDSDVDIQIVVRNLPAEMTDVDVTMKVYNAIKTLAKTCPLITHCTDAAMAAKQTLEFRLGGLTVDLRCDLNGGGSGRVLSDRLAVAVSAIPDHQQMGIRIFLAWVKGHSWASG